MRRELTARPGAKRTTTVRRSLRLPFPAFTAMSAIAGFTAAVAAFSAADCKAAVFARDAETELSVDPPGSPDGEGIFSFVHFTVTASEQDFDFGGRMKLDGKVYRLEQTEKTDGKVEIEGDLEGDQLEVRTSGLTDEEKKTYDFSGTYRKLPDAELQRRAQDRYAQADNWLNEVYSQAKQKLGTNSFADLKKRETDWIAYRDYFADQSSEINARAEGLPQEVARLQVLRDLTTSRIRFIRALFDDSLPRGITAVYDDAYGGVLQLEQDKKGVKFSLSVVRGPTSHTGDVSGRIILKNGNATFRDPEPEEGEAPAEIKFKVLDDRRIEIKARNDSYLHGARAYFDGVYFKSGQLTKSIELE